MFLRRMVRCVVYLITHVLYRMRYRGRHYLPDSGAAIVICNHVSFVDALVIGGASKRPLRFLMDKPIYENRWLNWLFRLVGAIPVDSERRDAGSLRRALDDVNTALVQGEIVMLFPEGRLTPDGDVQRFRRGLDIILARNSVPVVPAGLAGLWGSWTSHKNGPALSRWPRRFRAKVALNYGEPMAPEAATSGHAEARVRALKQEAEDWLASS
ncbi:1-acyl-sn-glycerol-3-phosphate acyltransferase [Halomonas halocynthiae]|uniref:1-acyl-sn-glycerol-3-phosphate acyltransferase n=1 Tax=Halomonas halocynthiae TaxID=176290 RepID=UPI000402287E|nr:1-acyl-sn-glycerol-3-phosphate acyltransferase [Halomonas halocynthiae]